MQIIIDLLRQGESVNRAKDVPFLRRMAIQQPGATLKQIVFLTE